MPPLRKVSLNDLPEPKLVRVEVTYVTEVEIFSPVDNETAVQMAQEIACRKLGKDVDFLLAKGEIVE
jgi:hypothetical protein